MFDLRPLYNFDASEGQIPEGNVSVYGPANSHANCVPASFTAALALAGYGDIDPQRLTNEIYGPNYRGGFGNFTRTIAWVRANVPNAPSMTDGGFDFTVADAAGQAGQLVIVAGWINAASVTFTAQANANGFSHASILAAHLPGGKWVIWNTWTGQMQTYDQAVLAASLYEMSVMGRGLHGGGLGGIMASRADSPELFQFLDLLQKGIFGTSVSNSTGLQADVAAVKDQLNLLQEGMFGTDALKPPGIQAQLEAILAAVKAIPAGSVASVDLKPVLDAIAALKFPTTISGKLS